MKTIFTLLFVFAAFLSEIMGSTNIPGGNVSGTWTLTGSPYYIQGEITVPLGSVLTIEPGVEVLFTGYYKMIVNGQLTAVGTKSQQIHFDAQSQWHGIHIMNSNTNGQDSTRLVYCHFEKGYASGSGNDTHGGALLIYNSSDVLIRGCTFINNTAVANGGAVWAYNNSNILIQKSIFFQNQATYGGGIYVFASVVTIEKATFTENLAATSGGAIYKPLSATVTVKNSILWDDVPGEIGPNPITITYSDVMGGYAGSGNINANPSFNDPGNLDFNLKPCSPCIDTGDPSSPNDPDGTRTDMGAWYFHHAAGSILPGGTLSGTLFAAVSPYYVCGSLTVPLGSTLTVEPGVEVRFGPGTKLDVNGRVIAEGTLTDSIVFTSLDQVSNLWNGINILNSNTNGQDSSFLRYCQVKHVGSGGQALNLSSSSDTRLSNTTVSFNNPGNRTIWLQQSNALVVNCDISNNVSSNTITIDNSSPLIRYCQFNGNSYSGTTYCIYSNSTSTPAVTDCVFDVNGKVPVYCYLNAVKNFHDNTYTGSTYRYFYVEGGTITHDSYWENPGIPYWFSSSSHIYIQGTDGADLVTTLTLAPGTILKFNGIYLWVGHDSNPSYPGALVAVGTPEQKITFTSTLSYPSPGNWYGIYFANYTDDTQCRLENCIVEYGGASSYDNLYINNASPQIISTISRYGSDYGIYVNNGSPGIENCQISNNTYAGILVNGGSPSIQNCQFTSNSSMGISVSSGAPTIQNCQFSGHTSYSINYPGNALLPGITDCAFDVNSCVPIYCHPNGVRNISNNTFTGTTYGYIYVHGGIITNDSYWENPGIHYRLGGNVYIQGTDGPDLVTTLTLEPGTIIQFASTVTLTVGHDSDPSLPGALVAIGTSGENITFTAATATPSPGYWGGLNFAKYSDDSQCRLEYCTVEYGGYSSYENLYLNDASPQIVNSICRYGSGAGIYVYNSSPAAPVITGCVISGNTTYGIYINSSSPSSPVISGCQISGNSSAGIYINSSSSSAVASPAISNCQITGNGSYGLYSNNYSLPVVTGCAFTNNSSYPIYCYVNVVKNLHTNTFSGNTYQYIYVEGGTITLDSYWDNPGIPYRVSSSSHIYIQGTDGPDGVTTLTLEQGTTIQFNPVYLWVGHDSNSSLPGALVAVGTPGQPITFTSASGTPAPGNWYGLYFANYSDDSKCRLEYCIVEYGGASSYENIYCNASSPCISHCEVRYGSGPGIKVSNATSMSIDHSVIRDNTAEGIWAQNSNLSLLNNVICRNAGDALRFTSPLSSEVKQNIVYDNHSPLYLASGSILATQIDHNDCWLHDTVYWSHMAPGFGNATQTNANGDMCDGYYNIFLDPMFVNATGNDFHLTENSPCINAGDPLMPFDPDSTIADMGVYSYYKPGYASITSIKDVPNDQGRQVQVIWGKSPLDESGGGQIEFYSLWREDPIFKEGGKEVISEREELYDKIKTDNDAGQETGVVLEQEDPLYWDNEGTILTYIASIPAMGFSQYSYIAPTLKDSCAASINYSKFELFAHTFNPLVYYRAVPDSGYSVDNIAPGAPLNLDGELAGDHISLDWDACTDPDFQHYALYKSEAPGSFPEIPFATTTDTLFNDFEIAFDTLYYRAAAYDINGNKSDYSNTVMVPINTGITLDLKVFLGGAYYGPYMSNSLNTAGFIPLSHPYGMTPWNYSGTEMVSSIPSANITDWVLIELRDALSASQATSATCFARQAAFLKIDGQVVGLDGSSLVNFSTEATHNLYVVVWHRNHLQIMSANAVTKTGGIYPYDFTTAMGQAYGGANAQKQVAPGVWAMIGGNGKPDNQVDNLDKNDVWRPESGLSGYRSGDFNLNGQVNNSDKVDVWRPNTGLGSQVPL